MTQSENAKIVIESSSGATTNNGTSERVDGTRRNAAQIAGRGAGTNASQGCVGSLDLLQARLLLWSRSWHGLHQVPNRLPPFLSGVTYRAPSTTDI